MVYKSCIFAGRIYFNSQQLFKKLLTMGNLTLSKDDSRFVIGMELIDTIDIFLNTGQIPGLPANPRYMIESDGENLEKSINEDPEFLHVRPLIVVPYAGKYVVIGGNMRLQKCIALGIKQVPCFIINQNTPVEKLKRLLIKDNANYGKWDWDMIANEWDDEPLTDWGVDMPFLDDNSGTGSGQNEGSVKVDNFKITLDCGEDQASYKQLLVEVGKLLKKFDGVEMKV